MITEPDPSLIPTPEKSTQNKQFDVSVPPCNLPTTLFPSSPSICTHLLCWCVTDPQLHLWRADSLTVTQLFEVDPRPSGPHLHHGPSALWLYLGSVLPELCSGPPSLRLRKAPSSPLGFSQSWFHHRLLAICSSTRLLLSSGSTLVLILSGVTQFCQAPISTSLP